MAELRNIRPLAGGEPIKTNDHPTLDETPEEYKPQDTPVWLINPNSRSQLTSYALGQAKRRIYKNLAAICIAFMLNFLAYQNLHNLQTYFKQDAYIGFVGLCTLYVVLVLASLVMPVWLVRHFGCKWIIVCCMITYALYMAAHFSQSLMGVIPSSVLLGLATAPLWVSKCVYVTQLAVDYAMLFGEREETIIVRFFGIFFMAIQLAYVLGQILSGLVLSQLSPPEFLNTNSTDIAELNGCSQLECGSRLVLDSVSNATDLPLADIHFANDWYILCGLYLTSSIFAVIVIVFLLDNDSPDARTASAASEKAGLATAYRQDYSSEEPEREREDSSCSWAMLFATVLQWRDITQLLIIPLTVYSGLQQAFFFGDIVQNQVRCISGVWMLIMVLICYGLVNSASSIGFGCMTKCTGRLPIFILGALIQCSLLVTWKLQSLTPAMFLVFAVLWAIADAAWHTQINSFYSRMFARSQREAAFTNYRLWQSVGFIIAFSYCRVACVYVKIIVLLIALILGMLGYFLIEYREKPSRDNVPLDNGAN